MNLRITIGFLVVALVLAVAVVGLDKFNIGPTASANATATAITTSGQQPQIFQFDDQKVNAFELHQADKSVRVEKQPDGWIVAGRKHPAHPWSVPPPLHPMSPLHTYPAPASPPT